MKNCHRFVGNKYKTYINVIECCICRVLKCVFPRILKLKCAMHLKMQQVVFIHWFSLSVVLTLEML